MPTHRTRSRQDCSKEQKWRSVPDIPTPRDLKGGSVAWCRCSARTNECTETQANARCTQGGPWKRWEERDDETRGARAELGLSSAALDHGDRQLGGRFVLR